MKSVIVIYVPMELGETEAVSSARKKATQQALAELKQTELYNDFHVLIISDPSRTKMNTQVFFKP